MKKAIIGLAAAALAAIGVASFYAATNTPANASVRQEERTQVFTIKNMTCATCPITVKKAMSSVDGVRAVNVDFDAKAATVVYDPSVATADEIAEASTNAGYPATAI